MNMNNKFESNEENVVDIELLRIEKLIEEREAYERDFFSFEPPIDKLDYIISRYEMEIEEYETMHILSNHHEDFENSFEFDEYLNQIRDEKLIEERELYEKEYFSTIDEGLVLNDIYDYQIEARQEDEFCEINRYDYDFEHEQEYVPDFDDYEYENEMFYKLLHLKEESLRASKPTCNCAYADYMPNDDGLCDYLDCYDYPEGPEENLCGVKYY